MEEATKRRSDAATEGNRDLAPPTATNRRLRLDMPKVEGLEHWRDGVVECCTTGFAGPYSNTSTLRCVRPLDVSPAKWRAPCAPVTLEDVNQLANHHSLLTAHLTPPRHIGDPSQLIRPPRHGEQHVSQAVQIHHDVFTERFGPI